MRLSRRFLPAALGLVALSVPVIAFAQDLMGTLATAENPNLGTILTDPSGRTVYSWQGDAQGSGTSNCNDACVGAWPPVLTDEATGMAVMGAAGGVSAIQRGDGTYQVTYSGWPLYYFARDTQPGDTNGQGANGFGALWSVVQP